MILTITHKYLRNILDNMSEENFYDFLVGLQYLILTVYVTQHKCILIMVYMMIFFTGFHLFKNKILPVNHYFSDYLGWIGKKNERYMIGPDCDGFIIDDENITFSWEYMRKFMKDLKISLLEDYSMHIFTIPEGD